MPQSTHSNLNNSAIGLHTRNRLKNNKQPQSSQSSHSAQSSTSSTAPKVNRSNKRAGAIPTSETVSNNISMTHTAIIETAKLNPCMVPSSTPSSVPEISSFPVTGDQTILTLTNLVKELGDRVQRMCIDFQRQITDLHGVIFQLVCNNNTAQLTFSPNDNILKIEKRIDNLERQLQSNIIAVDGILVINGNSDNDDIVNVFKSLCSIVGVTIPIYNAIYRTINKRNSTNSSILIKFAHLKDKTKFLSAFFMKLKSRKGRITLKDIGYDSDKRIFVHESLTKNNYKLFRRALAAKKDGLITTVFTRNGSVYVKKNVDDAPVHILNLADLAAIKGNNENENNINIEHNS